MPLCASAAHPCLQHMLTPRFTHACSPALPSPLQGVAGEVVKAVQEGHLKHIFLVGGCDGHGEWRAGLGGRRGG